MGLRRIKTRRGITLQDAITGKLAGSVGIGKDNAPTPGFQELTSKRFDVNATPQTIEELEYRHAQYKAEILKLTLENTASSISLTRPSEVELEEIVDAEEWDIVDIAPELVAQRNEELNLAEEEDRKISREIEKSKPKKTYHNPSTKAKKKKIGKAPIYRLPLEKYGPQWLEVNKLISFAGSLSPNELKKISMGHTKADFKITSIGSKVTFIQKGESIRGKQEELKATRKEAHKLLKSLNRETAIEEFLTKVPQFKGVLLIPADTTLGLILRDKISTKDYDLLTRAWRIRFGKIYAEDPNL